MILYTAVWVQSDREPGLHNLAEVRGRVVQSASCLSVVWFSSLEHLRYNIKIELDINKVLTKRDFYSQAEGPHLKRRNVVN